MKKHALDPLTIKYITGLEHENMLQDRLIKEQQVMIELLDKEILSLQEQIKELITSR